MTSISVLAGYNLISWEPAAHFLPNVIFATLFCAHSRKAPQLSGAS